MIGVIEEKFDAKYTRRSVRETGNPVRIIVFIHA